jgi:hypothetical protein
MWHNPSKQSSNPSANDQKKNIGTYVNYDYDIIKYVTQTPIYQQ